MEHAHLSLSLAGLSFAGSPIGVPDDNAPGSFVFGMQCTGTGCRTRLAIDISTRLSGAVVMWGWGGYLPAETLSGSTLLSWSSNPEWLGFLA
jgi:hypothetical protein